MAQLISLSGFDQFNLGEKTTLSSDALSNQSTLQVENIVTFSVNNFLAIGHIGSETCEIKKIQSISGKTITLTSSLDHLHKKTEPIQVLRYDQLRLYRAANIDGSIPPMSSFTLLATIPLEGDQMTVEYLDQAGGSNFWYRYTYYNSHSSSETPLGSSQAIRGGDYGKYASIDEIRIEAGFQNNTDVTDQMIADRREDAESEIKSVLYVAGYTLPLQAPVPPIIKNITKLLAAGYLLLQDYGVLSEGTNKEGIKKISLARELLEKIRTKEIVLIDQLNEVSYSRSGKIAGYPRDGSMRRATMHDQF